MQEIAIHSSHRKLAKLAYMHTDYKTGRIKVEEIPSQLLESYLKQNLLIVQQLDEFRELIEIALKAGDKKWFERICQAIQLIVQEGTR